MHFLLFLGSVRDSTPPKPARLGERVSNACASCFKAEYENHSLEIIDALDFEYSQVFKPEFAYSAKDKPASLDLMAKKIQSADAYLMVSPEYNHSMSPALSNLLNHFGSSLFAYKPSAIVTYSAGQWGGTRAAVSMRTFLSELGCLPVSAMIHIPRAHEVIDADGCFKQGHGETWQRYFKRTFAQLTWWAEACSIHKKQINPHSMIGDFKSDPSQRNAP